LSLIAAWGKPASLKWWTFKRVMTSITWQASEEDPPATGGPDWSMAGWTRQNFWTLTRQNLRTPHMATASYRSCPREAYAARSPACGGVASGFGLTGTSCRFPPDVAMGFAHHKGRKRSHGDGVVSLVPA